MDIASKQGVQNLRNKIFFCVAYEITLLSNYIMEVTKLPRVSVPYEITLLSNPDLRRENMIEVSVPYEITLLSN